ncbi:MAG: hypothetical protein NUV34_03355, partial [Sulfuricaulis sp.]|nr:hypothetical protein [Sulfuricaulis sp.]
PSTADPATFAAKADALLAALATLVAEINAAGGVNVGNATTLLGDTWADQVLASVAGTNTITATGPSGYALTSKQPLILIPAATNTGATTIEITPSGGASLGAKNLFRNGAACVGGELKIGVPAIIVYDGTQFNIVSGGVAVAGAELAYGQITSNVPVTATTAAGADVVVSSGAVTYDGTPVYVEFYAPIALAGTNYITFVLYDGATLLGIVAQNRTLNISVNAPVKITPSAGSHTYQIKAYVDAGSGTVYAGAGTGGAAFPASCRVVKA